MKTTVLSHTGHLKLRKAIPVLMAGAVLYWTLLSHLG